MFQVVELFTEVVKFIQFSSSVSLFGGVQKSIFSACDVRLLKKKMLYRYRKKKS